jgi:hypothetical protein
LLNGSALSSSLIADSALKSAEAQKIRSGADSIATPPKPGQLESSDARVKRSLESLLPPGQQFDIKFKHTARGTEFVVSGPSTESAALLSKKISAEGSQFWQDLEKVLSQQPGHAVQLKVGTPQASASQDRVPNEQQAHLSKFD